MTIFKHKTYKDFFRSYLKENHYKGSVSKVAEACGCDRTYLAQVLNGKADLTVDHVISFSENMGLNQIDSEFLLTLLLHDRSASITVKKTLKLKIETIKKEAEVLSQNIAKNSKTSGVSDQFRTSYYSSWLYAAVHILTSIPEFQTVNAISDKLQTEHSIIQNILKDLAEAGLISKTKDKYVHSSSDIYLPIEHPQNYSHHLNWRIKAVERTMKKEDVHYTNIYSVSKHDVENIRDDILKLIEQQRTKVSASGTDELCVFCCDFFKI